MHSFSSSTLLWFTTTSPCTLEEVRQIRRASEFRIIAADGPQLAGSHPSNINAILITVSGAKLDRDPEDLLLDVKRRFPGVPVVVYQPHGSVQTGTRFLRIGAFYYLGHPACAEVLLEAMRAACLSTAEVKTPTIGKSTLVGSSRAMAEVVETIRLVADRKSTVLITGETGTGKEVAAKAIHRASSRAQRPMVSINCAALPEHLLEAELFGHTKGAFTGAANARAGLFEKANHGTIFLDEIGEMTLSLQAKLLRVLQEREFHRIGSSEVVKIDVRVMAASNANLLQATAERRFREDLYYRLNVVPVHMPPLRARMSDIPELVEFFLAKIAAQENCAPKQISPDALDVLMSYSWPGNVRQLEHAIEAATVISGDRMLLLPFDFRLPDQPLAFSDYADLPANGLNFDRFISDLEKQLLRRALLQAGGNKARAAGLLSMKRTTLISKSKALQIA